MFVFECSFDVWDVWSFAFARLLGCDVVAMFFVGQPADLYMRAFVVWDLVSPDGIWIFVSDSHTSSVVLPYASFISVDPFA